MKGTKKVPADTSENKFVQKKLDEANAALRRMNVSVFEKNIATKQSNER